MRFLPLGAILLFVLVRPGAAWADDLLIEDFESGDYQGWEIRGEAFGKAPATGTLFLHDAASAGSSGGCAGPMPTAAAAGTKGLPLRTARCRSSSVRTIR